MQDKMRVGRSGESGKTGDREDEPRWVQQCDKDAPASKSGETPGDRSNGVISVRRRPKAGKHLETGPTLR
ncbi:hypothetical protein Y032_0653g1173 [Ancylostoma ceylanicum]|uniref:Uncharacterized protein n=1 Tax=Ancylostoma ceylanicum TaxID=53326 RepID=A0A016WIP4_9BILA|nr:hypothetical protein Y032_0653g1173 [Ancylostoma ceylanicum]